MSGCIHLTGVRTPANVLYMNLIIGTSKTVHNAKARTTRDLTAPGGDAPRGGCHVGMGKGPHLLGRLLGQDDDLHRRAGHLQDLRQARMTGARRLAWDLPAPGGLFDHLEAEEMDGPTSVEEGRDA